jgi:hypothetical protein
MRKTIIFGLFAALSVTAAAQKYYIGNKFIVGDTAWFKTHLLTVTDLGLIGSASHPRTRMEQTVYHHQYVISKNDSQTVMVTVYDSMQVSYTSDSSGRGIVYNSQGVNDSVSIMNMIVYPLRMLIGAPITVYLTQQGKVDSVTGLDAVVEKAEKPLMRSEQVQQIRQALSSSVMAESIGEAIASLPNQEMALDAPVRRSRARFLGRTQFFDDLVLRLQKVSGDTAYVNRITYTKIASPTIQYDGRLCVVDSTLGSGQQNTLFDIQKGIVLSSTETFDNYLRASVINTKSSIEQTNTLRAEVVLFKYAEGKR